MGKTTLNQLLAENLANLMAIKKVSANQLGAQAGLSPRTLANYLKKDHNPTSTGKERSAKLTEVEQLATALGVHPIELLSSIKDAKGAATLKTLRNEAANRQGPRSPADALMDMMLILASHMAEADEVTRDAVAPLLERIARQPSDGARIAETIRAIVNAASPAAKRDPLETAA